MAFYIQCVNSGKYLDVLRASKSKGTAVIIYEFNGAKNQQWTFKKGRIVSKHSGLVLDISGGGETGEIITWSDSGSDNQKWYFDEDFTIRSEMGTYLHVKDASTDNSAPLMAVSSQGSENQKFRVVPAGE